MTKTKRDLEYEATWDAEKLMSAEAIKEDAPRYRRAILASKKILKDREEQVKAARRVAVKTVRKTTKKPVRNLKNNRK